MMPNKVKQIIFRVVKIFCIGTISADFLVEITLTSLNDVPICNCTRGYQSSSSRHNMTGIIMQPQILCLLFDVHK